MIPGWYVGAVLVPQLVVTVVIAHGFSRKRRWERLLRRASREEVRRSLERTPGGGTVRLAFVPELLWCVPGRVLVLGSTGWLMLAVLYEFELLGLTRIVPEAKVRGLLAAVLALVYGTCAVAVLPGTPRPALPRLLAPAAVGGALGAVAVLKSLPPWLGSLAPVAMLVGLSSVIGYRGRLSASGGTAWDEVVEAVRYYPVSALSVGEREAEAAEKCALWFLACRVVEGTRSVG
ncbi:hypothetical protein [Methanopyrus kandleri]|uniref:Uncharacterized membrane protein specific for M.kandleri, MK-17 family n=1 Tax=Methanopyrus kandleri (strain AV19 / DSM 6324 / JCM 9639 / NBRC 100938) TaxID=190192 RepID=Q8TW74_METKA|nr:hypothetical protein [Methanopyrus kandleri]AAM02375.1 Uncharacterized membrane protein specific for M.kandleri, MK-17 family [Methanopyrus kandleri AV19]